jgi:hypothetical protein
MPMIAVGIPTRIAQLPVTMAMTIDASMNSGGTQLRESSAMEATGDFVMCVRSLAASYSIPMEASPLRMEATKASWLGKGKSGSSQTVLTPAKFQRLSSAEEFMTVHSRPTL